MNTKNEKYTNQEPRGEDYDRTLGQIIDYPALADFLLDTIRNTSDCSGIIDLACGTATLLRELDRRTDGRVLMGMDADSQQLEVARHRVPQLCLIEDNIIEPRNTAFLDKATHWHVHLGFNFLNEIDQLRQRTFFETWINYDNINAISVEVWNDKHQESYTFDEWHELPLPNGVLKARSVPLNADHRRVYLEFIYDVEGKVWHYGKEMYRFHHQELIELAKRIGWEVRNIAPATYRGGDGQSHYLITLVKQGTHFGISS